MTKDRLDSLDKAYEFYDYFFNPDKEQERREKIEDRGQAELMAGESTSEQQEERETEQKRQPEREGARAKEQRKTRVTRMAKPIYK